MFIFYVYFMLRLAILVFLWPVCEVRAYKNSGDVQQKVYFAQKHGGKQN